MPRERQLKAMSLYAGLMDEVKIRLDAINFSLRNSKGVAAQITREFCFLQLRMLCEIIALGCLVSHGDIEETTKLKKEYAADKIIGRLQELHPNFYPWPIQASNTSTSEIFHFTILETGFLTKAELIQLHGQCGSVLHRGSLKKLMSSENKREPGIEDIRAWGQKIHNLLAHHGFSLFDKQTITLCMLRNPSDNNRVQVALGESKPDPPAI